MTADSQLKVAALVVRVHGIHMQRSTRSAIRQSDLSVCCGQVGISGSSLEQLRSCRCLALADRGDEMVTGGQKMMMRWGH